MRSRSFQAQWFDCFKWLHYDEEMDAAICHVYAKAEDNGRLAGSTRKDAAFLTKDFTNWKDATMSFTRHEVSDCHKETFEAMITLPKSTSDVAETLSKSHSAEKKENRKLFIKILLNITFLARQRIALRGDGSGADSNFLQLLKLQGQDDLRISGWMAKRQTSIQGQIYRMKYYKSWHYAFCDSNSYHSVTTAMCPIFEI